jgi:hypothetical protein
MADDKKCEWFNLLQRNYIVLCIANVLQFTITSSLLQLQYHVYPFTQNFQLYNNESAGIRINGMTLLLTNLKPNYGGKYFCQAMNEVGKGKSNPLLIQLQSKSIS